MSSMAHHGSQGRPNPPHICWLGHWGSSLVCSYMSHAFVPPCYYSCSHLYLWLPFCALSVCTESPYTSRFPSVVTSSLNPFLSHVFSSQCVCTSSESYLYPYCTYFIIITFEAWWKRKDIGFGAGPSWGRMEGLTLKCSVNLSKWLN